MSLVDQARTYLGTPWKHRGRSRKGIDCAGIVVCSYADLGVTLPDIERYGREPHRDGLMTAVRAGFGEPVNDGPKVGDLAVMTSGALGSKEPHHLGIMRTARWASLAWWRSGLPMSTEKESLQSSGGPSRWHVPR
jgi:cell wall-associated NlpC family hydrolase